MFTERASSSSTPKNDPRDPHAEILAILRQHSASRSARDARPDWARRVSNVLVSVAIVSWVFFYGTALLHWMGLVDLKKSSVVLALWYFSVISASCSFLAAWLVDAMYEARRLVGRRFWDELDQECRTDCGLAEKLACYSLSELSAVHHVTTMRSSGFLDREALILGPLTKIPLIVSMLVSVVAVVFDVKVSLPKETGLLAALFPSPVGGVLLGGCALVFTVFRMLIYVVRDRVDRHASFLKAAIELKTLPSATVILPETSTTLASNALDRAQDEPSELRVLHAPLISP